MILKLYMISSCIKPQTLIRFANTCQEKDPCRASFVVPSYANELLLEGGFSETVLGRTPIQSERRHRLVFSSFAVGRRPAGTGSINRQPSQQQNFNLASSESVGS